MFSNNLFNHKETVVIKLDANVQLTAVPVCGGVNATLEEVVDIGVRREKAFFATVDELVKSLRLSDEHTIALLAKAF